MELSEEIRQILKLSSEEASICKVVDRDGDLVMVSYDRDKFNPDIQFHRKVGLIRGVVIDLVHKMVVCSTLGYDSFLPIDSPLEETDSKIIIKNTQIQKFYSDDPHEVAKVTFGQMEFDKDKIAMFPGGEPVVIRFFKWNGKIHASTYTKINAGNSSWSGRIPFMDGFRSINPYIDPEAMFGSELFSPYIHSFISFSKEATGLVTTLYHDYIFNAGIFKCWSEEEHPDLAPEPIQLFGFGPVQAPYPEPFEPHGTVIPYQPLLNVEQANAIMFPRKFAKPVPEEHSTGLLNGDMFIEFQYKPVEGTDGFMPELEGIYAHFNDSSNDPRLGYGNSVVVYLYSNPLQIYVMIPDSLAYRQKVTGNNPVTYNQFVLNINKGVKETPTTLSEIYPPYVGEDGKPLDLKDPNQKRELIASAFIDALSPFLRSEANNYLEKYYADVNQLAGFILNKYSKLSPESRRKLTTKTIERLDSILRASAKNKKSRHDLIVSMLMNETPTSLYKMITSTKRL